MLRHARPSRVPAALATLFLTCAAVPAAAQAVSARIEPGLSGVARAGRWMPVVLVLENNGRPLDALVTVRIGAEHVSREVSLPAPSRRRLELYFRAPDTDAATATLDVSGVTASATVRIVPSDAPFTLCVTAGGVSPSGATCTAVLDAAALPGSWRGFDAADDVVMPAGAATVMATGQRLAHARWAAVRAWNRSTSMAPPAPAVPETGRGGVSATRELSLHAAAVLLLAFSTRWISRRPARLYVAVVLLAIAGSAAVLAHGRFGEAGALVVHDASVVRAGVTFDGAQWQVRGTALFPSARHVSIGTALQDGELLVRRGGGTLRSGFSAGGDAVITGRATRQQRLEFTVDGFADEAPLDVARGTAGISLTNRLSSALVGCTLPDGFEPATIARIEPAGSVDVRIATDVMDTNDVNDLAGAALTCVIERTSASLTWNGGPVAHQGAAVLVYDLRGQGTHP